MLDFQNEDEAEKESLFNIIDNQVQRENAIRSLDLSVVDEERHMPAKVLIGQKEKNKAVYKHVLENYSDILKSQT